MSNKEENKKQAAEKLRQLANGNIPETNISFSYEGTKPEIQMVAEAEVFKQNLHSATAKKSVAIC